MAGDFSARVSSWCDLQKENLRLVAVQSFLDVGAEAQENAPVKDGTLRDSFNVSLTAMPQMQPEETSKGGDPTAATAGFQLGQTIYGAFVVKYARRVEYGFTGVDSLGRYYDQQPAFYLRRATQNWQSIVDRNARRAQAREAFR